MPAKERYFAWRIAHKLLFFPLNLGPIRILRNLASRSRRRP
jgi:hypothetical protein